MPIYFRELATNVSVFNLEISHGIEEGREEPAVSPRGLLFGHAKRSQLGQPSFSEIIAILIIHARGRTGLAAARRAAFRTPEKVAEFVLATCHSVHPKSDKRARPGRLYAWF